MTFWRFRGSIFQSSHIFGRPSGALEVFADTSTMVRSTLLELFVPFERVRFSIFSDICPDFKNRIFIAPIKSLLSCRAVLVLNWWNHTWDFFTKLQNFVTMLKFAPLCKDLGAPIYRYSESSTPDKLSELTSAFIGLVLCWPGPDHYRSSGTFSSPITSGLRILT